MTPNRMRAWLLCWLLATAACGGWTLRIASDATVEGAFLSVSVPDDLKPGVYRMRGSEGDHALLQVDAEGTGWFRAGRSATYRIDPRRRTPTPEVRAEEAGATIRFRHHTREILSFYHQANTPPDSLGDAYRRGGYIHPVRSPEGAVVTGHLNGPYHMHHSGLWSAWTRTRYQDRSPDFWNSHLGTAKVDIDTLYHTWSGPVHGGLRARNRFTDLTGDRPVPVLNEDWTIRAYAVPADEGVHIFDVDLSQEPVGDDPLYLPEYLYGGFGFRANPQWRDTLNMSVLTSEGLARIEGHASRSRWVAASGRSDGRLAGIAILSHPSNVRFPQPMRIHPTEPFINYAPTQLGDMVIVPGTPYRMRYRMVVFDGAPDAALIERLWAQYAAQPLIRVERTEP